MRGGTKYAIRTSLEATTTTIESLQTHFLIDVELGVELDVRGTFDIKKLYERKKDIRKYMSRKLQN